MYRHFRCYALRVYGSNNDIVILPEGETKLDNLIEEVLCQFELMGQQLRHTIEHTES
jgi:hypothetical protein